MKQRNLREHRNIKCAKYFDFRGGVENSTCRFAVLKISSYVPEGKRLIS